MTWLTEKIEFPLHETATKEGLIAMGGDLSPERIIHAYRQGIFPWYSEGEPILWYSPPKRMVLFPNELKISKSTKRLLKKKDFQVTENKAFQEVINHCKNIRRKGSTGTWITNQMEQAYIKLHQLGVAKSIEVWLQGELIGGLYGLEINAVFCGESMFSRISNASKVAFVHLGTSHQYQLIDCQVYNEHLASLGAREITRNDFLAQL